MNREDQSSIYENPYAASDLDNVEPPVVVGAKRPLFIAILAVLQIIGGVLLIASLITLANTSYTVGTIPSLRLLWITVPAGLLRLVTGIGMWIGTRWGWWLACTVYMMQLCGSLATLAMVFGAFTQSDVLGRPVSYMIGRAFGAGLFGTLILALLYRDNVLAFFGMTGQSKRLAILVTALAGFALYLAQQVGTMAAI